MTKPLKVLFSLVFIFFFLYSFVYAECTGTFVNPITDICWKCIFPIKIGGVAEISFSDVPPDEEEIDNPICVCGMPPHIGVTASFWEPARMIETVKDPYCFTLMGTQMSSTNLGSLGGSNKRMGHTTFAQAHYYIFPVWGILDLFLDLPCVEYRDFDLAYITEVDPMWNSDLLTIAINPEALLFAEPAAQFACMADSVAASTSLPYNSLFWCMGSWGSAYPLAGVIGKSNYIEANAGLAARMLYKLSRELLACDPGVNVCGCTQRPVWRKTHYRFQLVRPVRDNECYPIGKSSMLWERNKNPIFEGDNFLWMLFRKNLCCMYMY
jgi:conjugal transfer pilus assembly protein TraU